MAKDVLALAGEARDYKAAEERGLRVAPFPRLLVLSFPLCFPSGSAVKLRSEKAALWACLGML